MREYAAPVSLAEVFTGLEWPTGVPTPGRVAIVAEHTSTGIMISLALALGPETGPLDVSHVIEVDPFRLMQIAGWCAEHWCLVRGAAPGPIRWRVLDRLTVPASVRICGELVALIFPAPAPTT